MSIEKRYEYGSFNFNIFRSELSLDHELKMAGLYRTISYSEVTNWASALGYINAVEYDYSTEEWIVFPNGDYCLWGSIMYAKDDEIMFEAKLKFL